MARCLVLSIAMRAWALLVVVGRAASLVSAGKGTSAALEADRGRAYDHRSTPRPGGFITHRPDATGWRDGIWW